MIIIYIDKLQQALNITLATYIDVSKAYSISHVCILKGKYHLVFF